MVAEHVTPDRASHTERMRAMTNQTSTTNRAVAQRLADYHTRRTGHLHILRERPWGGTLPAWMRRDTPEGTCNISA